MLKAIFLIAQVVCLSLIVSVTANAGTTVFDNFGPGDTYNTTAGWTIENAFQGVETLTPGEQFTPSSDGFVSDIFLAASLSSGSNDLDVALMSDASGLPGSVLETWNFLNDMGSFGSNNSPLHGIGNGTVEILSGVPYWLVASAPDAGTVAVWNWNNTGDIGTLASSGASGFGGPWIDEGVTNRGAFRVEVNPIPEPSTLLLLGAGLAGIGLLRRRFKK